ncbi:MAG: hypothetical protein JW748_02785 [Anaerolineales bacterium]|nr:hypothetical protein [Anaerolineales bacterium]
MKHGPAAAGARGAARPALFLLVLMTACRATGADPAPSVPTPGASEPGGGLTAASPGLSLTMTAVSVFSPTATAFVPHESVEPIPPETQAAFGSCADNLVFMGDLTYPDRALVFPGQALEKQWKVRNAGRCDWGPEYRFRRVGGAALSAREEFALYPAAAGSEAVISIHLTAPLAPGDYISSFRAFSPLGIAFGDTLYIDVVVA